MSSIKQHYGLELINICRQKWHILVLNRLKLVHESPPLEAETFSETQNLETFIWRFHVAVCGILIIELHLEYVLSDIQVCDGVCLQDSHVCCVRKALGWDLFCFSYEFGRLEETSRGSTSCSRSAAVESDRLIVILCGGLRGLRGQIHLQLDVKLMCKSERATPFVATRGPAPKSLTV